MATMIALWNPDEWPDGVAEHHFGLLAERGFGLSIVGPWSTGSRKYDIGYGDTVYMLMVGDRGRGVIRSGIALEGISQDGDWRGGDREANYIKRVEWRHFVPVEDALPTETLKDQIPEVNWDRMQASGVVIDEPAAQTLDDLWLAHIGQA
ncbi:hypothetical protein [Mycolicibacterium psychrotolerans]|uniref:EVE domain-containing protein n=1 Tax=Mycolicibacterium psychrotolerans TaxID=216929 RepID=A0A7I7MBU6_9MYCO|nr:hypothetical protein [Mycolicibacterium psychrotolerans]BBX69247.1 hypothetical protein MPSYJ_27080 [Mycolicibacterium psychrotolerans]